MGVAPQLIEGGRAQTLNCSIYSYPKCSSLCASSGYAWERTSENSVLAKFAFWGFSEVPALSLCAVAHTALEHIHSPQPGVWCVRHAASAVSWLREGAGRPPALLLD